MNSRIVVLVGLSLFAWGEGALAQDIPAPPYVKTPPSKVTWNVQIEYPNASKMDPGIAAALPTRLAIKSGRNGVTLGEITYGTARRSQFYVVDDFLLQTAANSGRVISLSSRDLNRDPNSLMVTIFPGTSWISRENYVATEKKRGMEILYFSQVDTSGIYGEPGVKLEAWISKENRYPLEVRRGKTATYRFSEIQPFLEDIPLPEAFQAKLNKRRAQHGIRPSN